MPFPFRAGDACGARSSRATHIMCVSSSPSPSTISPPPPSPPRRGRCGERVEARLVTHVPLSLFSSRSRSHSSSLFSILRHIRVVDSASASVVRGPGRLAHGALEPDAKKPKGMSGSGRRDGGKKDGRGSGRGCGRGRCRCARFHVLRSCSCLDPSSSSALPPPR
ncbi:hypothetical protein B0H14DRAFT_1159855 [Mycena olivaceomarginata]|nr:hypothetical protein B0H14DRAFT_1659733 [Mycena olivaceomarginata]KAJ7834142.1 hypothetical protein B0H14DRAFT_1159855 [Mycena olivaceomarginata]